MKVETKNKRRIKRVGSPRKPRRPGIARPFIDLERQFAPTDLLTDEDDFAREGSVA
jgi:hypothetical protein